MKFLLLCLLAALPLIASEDQSKPLTCLCTGPDCKDGLCSVDQGGRCMVVVADTTLGSTDVSGTFRTCLPKGKSCPEGQASFTVNQNVYWRSNTTCCSGEKCNTGDLKVPPAEPTSDELICPSCFGTNSSTCNAVPQKCAASEKYCITVSGFVIIDDLSTEAVPVAVGQATTKDTHAAEKETTTTAKATTKDAHAAEKETTAKATTKDAHAAEKETTPTAKATTKDTHAAEKETTPTAKATTKDAHAAEKETTPTAKAPTKVARNVTFFARGCSTKEVIADSDIPLILNEDTFHFTSSHGNPSLVPGSIALTILLPSLTGLLLGKVLY